MGKIDPIVECFADVSFQAVRNGGQLIGELRQIRSNWDEALVARRHATVWRALDVIMRQPVISSQVLRAELGVSNPTAG